MAQSSHHLLQSHLLGALLAHHAGDSLGATLEFTSHAEIQDAYPPPSPSSATTGHGQDRRSIPSNTGGLRDIIGGGPFHWPPGHATDDSDMTRAVLLAYRDVLLPRTPGARTWHTGVDVAARAGEYFLCWLHGENWPDRRPGSRPVDIGNATLKGLQQFERSRDVRACGAGSGAAGNGSLMRCIPTAIVHALLALGQSTDRDGQQQEGEEKRSDAVVEESILISGITHDDPRCTLSCAVYNLIAVDLFLHSSSPSSPAPPSRTQIVTIVDQATSLITSQFSSTTHPEALAAVIQAIEHGKHFSLRQGVVDGPLGGGGGGEKDAVTAVFPDACAGYVLDSLTLAIAALLDDRPLEDVLVDVVRMGNDTDTNGAVAGGLLGARDGEGAVPKRWVDLLQFGEEYRSVIAEMFARAQSTEV